MTGATLTSEAIRVPRMRLIAATLAAKRAQHPELCQAPTLAVLEAIAEREGIAIHASSLPPCMLGLAIRAWRGGVVTIADDINEVTRTLVVLHELSHLWLGHCEDGALNTWLVEERGAWWAPTLHGPLCARTEDEANMLTAAILGTTHRRVLARLERTFERRMMVDQQAAA